MSFTTWYSSRIPGFHQLNEEEKRKHRIEIMNSISGTLICLLIVILFHVLDHEVLSLAFLIPTIICFANIFLSLKKKFRDWVPSIGSLSVASALMISKVYYPHVLMEIGFLPVLAGHVTNPSKSLHKKVAEIGLIAGYTICILITWYESHAIFNAVNEDHSFSNILLVIEVISLITVMVILHNFSKIQQKYELAVRQKNEEILSLEAQKQEQKLLLKQRDMELLQVENEIKLKVNEKIFKGIKTILTLKGDVRNPLKELFIDLKGKIDKDKQINFKHRHIELLDSEFYDRLSNEFPDLSRSEIELCAYLKLQLSNKEIAALRNVSFNGVNVSKNRLRKKMNLDSNAALSRFLLSF
ncbi:MAG: LuxR C-terminal-related transcriptional regulator [Bacteroidota bacterium]